jgi:hypothetical protein
MEIVKSKDKMTPLCYDWRGLTSGELLLIAELCKDNRLTNPIANDCYCSIRSGFYEHDKELYNYVEKL